MAKLFGVREDKCLIETMSKDELILRTVLNSTGEEPKGYFINYAKTTFSDYKTRKSVPYVETYFATNFNNMFSGCENLRSVPYMDTSKGYCFSNMFEACLRLVRVPDLDVSNATDVVGMFDGCNILEYLDDNPLLKNKAWQFKDNISFGYSPLNRDSILKVFNGLQVVQGKTITISSKTNEYISDEDKAIATNKGWNVEIQPWSVPSYIGG